MVSAHRSRKDDYWPLEEPDVLQWSMSQEQAKYLCGAARTAIDAAIGQAWALAFPTASVTWSTASG
jgi:hypothetical protein